MAKTTLPTIGKGCNLMKYHSEIPEYYTTHYGELYFCDHPLYDRCTLFKIGDKGLAVIQQRYDHARKVTSWTELDKWLPDTLYLNENFMNYFEGHAEPAVNGLYPTVPVRKLMWALKMKPLQKNYWETVFDHPINFR